MAQLIELPKEIRLMIYELVFKNVKIRAKPRQRTRQETAGKSNNPPNSFERFYRKRRTISQNQGAATSDETAPHLAIPLTCRAFRDDANTWRSAMQAMVLVVVEHKVDIINLKRVVTPEEATKIKTVLVPATSNMKRLWGSRTIFRSIRTVFRNLRSIKIHAHYGIASDPDGDHIFPKYFDENLQNSGDVVASSMINALQEFNEYENMFVRNQRLVYEKLIQFNFKHMMVLIRSAFDRGLLIREALSDGIKLDLVFSITECQNGIESDETTMLRGNLSSEDDVLRIERHGRIVEIPQDTAGAPEFLNHFLYMIQIDAAHK